MSDKLSEEQIRDLARKRVEAKTGFYIHLIVYLVVNAFLFLIWYFAAGTGYPWFFWPLGGWGLGLIFHGISVFTFLGSGDWERREIDKEIAKIRKNQGN